jgi:hypothetical protein
MEPLATATSLGTKALSVIKDLPLWLLTGIALSLAAFLSIPEFCGAVSEDTRTWLAVAATAFAIFAGCRFVSVIISLIGRYRSTLEAQRTFHLTPITYRSFWSATRQKDGTVVTQLRTEFMAKNRTDKILHLLTARVIRPKIRGQLLHVMILTGVDTNLGVDCLPPGATVHISVVIMIRGFPAHVREHKKLRSLAAVLSLADDEGNEQRVKLPLEPAGPDLSKIAN